MMRVATAALRAIFMKLHTNAGLWDTQVGFSGGGRGKTAT